MRRVALLCAAVALVAPAQVRAHEPRATMLLLDVGVASLRVEARIPVDQLVLAHTGSFTVAPLPYARAHLDALTERAAGALTVTSPSGERFALTVESSEVHGFEDVDCVVLRARLTAPSGETHRLFQLADRTVLGAVVNHRVLVWVRSDLRHGLLGDDPELAGVLDWRQGSVSLDRTGGSWRQGLAAAARRVSRVVTTVSGRSGPGSSPSPSG